MFAKLDVTRMAQALASYAGTRQGAIARNIAQADTPGYRAVDMPDFAETYRQDVGMLATRSGHMQTGGSAADPVPRRDPGGAAPNGNTVSLEAEMVKAADVKSQHDMALSIYRSVSDILRASLGRR
ncbi:MAG: flagellar basal body rod protein FlgB [Cereibacter sphaeroides]|uniref:Flagellar basal body rod protein FlgB n=1 Tax=Cereibacter sphaeroides TaxID=1063 RepID=A0A2W5SFH7_CERSP|nr:MAG: flagellar basal body rod protein FlgB [Cereibacter sphaeroides]